MPGDTSRRSQRFAAPGACILLLACQADAGLDGFKFNSGRPAVSERLLCQGRSELDGRYNGAIADLRQQLGRFSAQRFLLLKLHGRWWGHAIPKLAKQGHCWTAQWALSLLFVEISIQNLSHPWQRVSWNRVLALNGEEADGPLAAIVNPARKSSGVPSVVSELLLSPLPSWLDIATSQWSIFRLVNRFAASLGFWLLVRKHLAMADVLGSVPERSLVDVGDDSLKRRLEVCALFLESINFPSPNGLLDSMMNVTNILRSAGNLTVDIDWHIASASTARAERLVKERTAALTSAGMPNLLVIGAVLCVGAALGVWSAVEELLTPSWVQLRVPDSYPECQAESGCELLNSLATVPLHGSKVRHCSTFWGRSGASLAARKVARLGEAELPRLRHAFLMRVERRPNLMSDNVRNRCGIMCNSRILEVLYRFRDSRMVKYVDIGAAIGDCMLAAATIVPAGKLSGVAFEANGNFARIIKMSANINGFAGKDAWKNSSKIRVRNLALGRPGQKFQQGMTTHAGFIRGRTGPRIRTSTLDLQMRGLGWHIDILSIFVNGGALDAL
eukprot:TRINITY_DN12085_c0_g1_i4.p1 TRINITY_DN12085_c0_g1~~TRINITY_DN12085_c0_g1_i4.p1  ORF type:complete len:559 (+),score=64.94 TRINITY_DN12085_c0_g1_i4:80-1756(+)